MQSYLYYYLGVVEWIMWVFITSYGEICFDMQVLWIASMFPEQIMLSSQGFTVYEIGIYKKTDFVTSGHIL